MKAADRKIRKNIVISESINKQLKEMAEYYKKPQSVLIEELSRGKLKEYKKKRSIKKDKMQNTLQKLQKIKHSKS